MGRSSLSSIALVFTAGLVLLGSACRKDEADVAQQRRASDRATEAAEKEAQSQETSLTSATVEAKKAQAADDALHEGGEVLAAFQLEQSDYRGRLQQALDALDAAIHHTANETISRGAGEGRSRDLRARRDLLKADLDAVNRSTEPDWATLRTKVERDLELGRPGSQLLPRTERSSGEP
jgi:hypothetical protein